MKIDSCPSCSHSEVCMYKTSFEEAQKAVDKVVDANIAASIFKPVKVECKYFDQKGGNLVK